MIETLNESHYLGFMKNVNHQGSGNLHLARIRLSNGKIHTAYIKLYPNNTHEFVNEITGHILSTAVNLPTPKHAGIIMIKKNAIKSLPSWAKTSPGDTIPAWFTEDTKATSVKIHYNLSAPIPSPLRAKISREFLQSQDIEKTIAFDDWIGNIDRNMGNILRISKGKYIFIDNGMTMLGKCWNIKTLENTNHLFPNTLRTFIGLATNDPKYLSALANHAKDHINALIKSVVETSQWWHDLLPQNLTDAGANFIDTRATDDNINTRYQILL